MFSPTIQYTIWKFLFIVLVFQLVCQSTCRQIQQPLWLTQQQDYWIGGDHSPNVNNADDSDGLNIWHKISSPWGVWPGVGYCRNGSSLIAGIPNTVCQRKYCIFSQKENVFVDTSKLTKLQWDRDSKKELLASQVRWNGDVKLCQLPGGGHLPTMGNNGKREGIEVSFLYTLYNNPVLAANAILEVFRNTNEVASAEFVVIDDGSTEDMSPVTNLLRSIEYFFDIPVISRSHSSSSGYLVSNNEAMRLASGEFAILLNSDVVVLPGCLNMLLRTIKTYPGGNVGMVGPLMLDNKGNIMEAGGGIFRYGQPFNSARGFRPLDLSMHHARVVDYISAACLLVRRKLFLSLGLFDEKYAPAYFEDTDAALVHAEHGWKTILQPLSVVLHHEGSSYGKSGKSTVKDNLMEINSKKFRDAHHGLVDNYCPAPKYNSQSHTKSQLDVHMGHSFYRQQHRVLFLEDIVPEPDREAGSIRLFAMLQILTELGMSVTFEPLAVPNRTPRYLLSLFADGINAVVPGTLRDMALSAITLRSFSESSSYYSSINLCPYDLIIIGRRDVFTHHIADVKVLCPTTPIIFDTVDVHFIRELRSFNVTYNTVVEHKSRRDKNNLMKKKEALARIEEDKAMEVGYVQLSNVTLVVSTEEQRILKEMLGNNADVRVISNIYTVGADSDKRTGNTSQSVNHRSGAVFVGNMCHSPNVDAVDFIVRHILGDQSMAKLPLDFKMHFVWSRSHKCPHEILRKAERHPLVVIHRDISDEELYDLHQQVRVVLAPLRFGAGVKGKVNYALLHGVPVIGTKVATEGMNLVHELNCLLAETGEEFVNAINRITTDDNLFDKIAMEGKQIMRTLFGRDVALMKLKQVIVDLGVSLPVVTPITPVISSPNNSTTMSAQISLGGAFMCPFLHDYDHSRFVGSFWRNEAIGTDLPPYPRPMSPKLTAKERKKLRAQEKAISDNASKRPLKPREAVKRSKLLIHDEGVTFPIYPRLPYQKKYIQFL